MFTAAADATTKNFKYAVKNIGLLNKAFGDIYKIILDDIDDAATRADILETTADNDLFLVYDSSATTLKKVQSQYLVGIASRTELAERPANNDLFLVYDTSTTTIKKIQASNIVTASVTRTGTGDGSTVGFTVTSGTTVNSVLVFLNGVAQKPTTDYTISSTTLTFGTAPTPGESIVIRELPA